MQRHEILQAYSPFIDLAAGQISDGSLANNGVMTVCFFGRNDHVSPPSLSVKSTFTRDFALVPKDANQAKMPWNKI